MALMSDWRRSNGNDSPLYCINNQQISRGGGENQRIMLHDMPKTFDP